eukprot:gene7978-10818_t
MFHMNDEHEHVDVPHIMPVHRPVPKPKSTVAERAVWMTRTSDVVGSHFNTDLDSYLTLIRRKVQEKMSTTMELITQIRRFKVSDSAHVTPNEFRFTLIKFGIILPQPLVDRIFNVFDSDRSGTMDFDEFAMWIMNSEFRPTVANKSKDGQIEDTPSERLRKKFLACIEQNPAYFRTVKSQISILQFFADISRLNMGITEKEARTIFQILDPSDSGFVQSGALIHWAQTGRSDFRSTNSISTKHAMKQRSLPDLLHKVVGRNSKQLQNAFSHIQLGQGTKISFDEFRRCLLNAGLGKNISDTRQLWLALGGDKSAAADVDMFFNSLPPVITDPLTEVSSKNTPSAAVYASRADRFLRDAIRKSFSLVKADLNAADLTQSGFIEADALHKILVKRCMPLSFQDFRFIIQQIKKDSLGRVDIKHFLHGYDPMIAPHMLEGSATLKSYNNDINLNQTLSSTLGSNPLASTMPKALKSVKIGKRAESDTEEASVVTRAKTADSKDDMRKIWQVVLRECHRSDPERNGEVSRNVFIAAIEKAKLGQTMSPEEINKIADKYTQSNGLINYLHFFRNYLNDMVGGSILTSLSKAKSTDNLDRKSSTEQLTSSQELKLRPLHPWDFDYKRDKHPAHPYWHTAAANPRDITLNLSKELGLLTIPPPNEKSANDLSQTEKTALLSQYNEKTLQICNGCYKQFAPIWRNLRNDFKRAQITSQRGSILVPNFIAILEKNGIILNKTDLGSIIRVFRGLGMQEVVKYDEFLRVCMLVKDDKY